MKNAMLFQRSRVHTGGGRHRGARSRLWLPVVAMAGVLGLALPLAFEATIGTPSAAHAAGNAQLLVSVVAVDPVSGVPISSVSPGVNSGQVAFRVDFSCVSEVCSDSVVTVDPMALDPIHNTFRLFNRTGFNPPVGGGTLTGSDTAGYQVALGDLAAGSAGSFTLIYSLNSRENAAALHAAGRADNAPSMWPNGAPITVTVTGSNSNSGSVGDASATSSPIAWSVPIPDPAVGHANPRWNGNPSFSVADGGTLSTGSSYSYPVAFSTGCWVRNGNDPWARSSNVLCASDYTVTHHLPPGAELTSATGSPTVTGSVATGLELTWQSQPWTSAGPNADGGWGARNGFDYRGMSVRTVTITFPKENLAPVGQPCDYDVQISGMTTDATVTYLSMPGTPGTVKTATQAKTGPFTVSCRSPFPRAVGYPKRSTFNGQARPVTNESQVSVPVVAGEVNEQQWEVEVSNTANIDGVAVVTDNELDQPDLPVYQIVAPAGSSTDWTATNGTDTLSGTTVGTVDAPAGYRFVTAVTTSPTLAAPNRRVEDTHHTDFTVIYKYRVSFGAPVGTRHTNHASAVMTWPDNPEFADTPLTIDPHTVVLAVPFGGATIAKRATKRGYVQSHGTQEIPASGQVRVGWQVVVRNYGNSPGVPIIEEPHLGSAESIRIDRIVVNGNIPGWTVQYTLDDGTTGTAGLQYYAPAGRYITAATITGAPLAGPNSPGRSDFAQAVLYIDGLIDLNTHPGNYPNTATGRMTYPGYDIDPVEFSDSADWTFTTPNPVMTARWPVGPQLSGGGTVANPSTDVTFSVGGSTSQVPTDRDITPEYVFVAPEGWNITAGSAKFAAGTVPAGASFHYRTVTIAGVQRQAVVASWPPGTVFGENRALPTMTVVARPGASVPAGTSSRPDAFIGNSNTVLAGDTFTNPFTDAPDFDADSVTDEQFSHAADSSDITVGAVAGMQVLKEICKPDSAKADGCDWYSDASSAVGVAPNATGIKYRLTVTNTGNTDLSDVVGYDVLPYVGDTGTSSATASTPRGSTFRENVSEVGAPTNGATVTFSPSTQPCRPEVDASVPGCANDWSGTSAGAQALRLERSGALAPGQSFSMTYSGAVLNAPSNGAIACNSFAVKATGLGTVSEPSAVCATTQEADLEVVAGTPQLQQGRPGVLPFTITNLSGATPAGGTVSVTIPLGVTATDFSPTGWVCTAVDANDSPLYGSAPGPATLFCDPNTPFVQGVPVALDVPVVPAASLVMATATAEVVGRLFDPVHSNDADTLAVSPTAEAGDPAVTKDDGVTSARPGDTVTYTVSATNPLDFETLTGASMVDTLPFGVEFVSASGGGTHAAGVVTWSLPDIPGTGSVSRTVTVKVLPTIAVDQITNTVDFSAPDPANPDVNLMGSANDVDAVVTDPSINITKDSTETEYDAVGDVIHYTFDVENTGDVTLHGVAITDALVGLTAVTYSWPGDDGVLAPGEAVRATASYTVTQQDLDSGMVDNTATVSGNTPGGSAVGDTSSHTVPSTAVAHVSVTKSTSSTVAAAGDVIEYQFTVVNDGALTLNHVTLTDPLPGLQNFEVVWPGLVGVLAPGETATASATYVATQTDVDAGQVMNTANGSGETVGGAAVIDSASVTVPIVATPAIQMVKSGNYAPGTNGAAGDTLKYTFTVTNSGNVTLTGVTIDDPLPGLSALTYTWPAAAGVLAPGQVVTATASYVVSQADVDGLAGVDNTATVTGMDPSNTAVTSSDTVHLDTPATSGIQVLKTGVLRSSNPVVPGDRIDYTFQVTNLGVVTLHSVDLADALTGLSSITLAWPGTDGVLAPGATVTGTASYTLTQADIDSGSIQNTATTSGISPADETVNDSDTITTVLPAAPSIMLIKTATGPSGVWAVGDTVRYRFTVTNTGNLTEVGVTIIDQLPELSPLTYQWPGSEGVLAPGATAIATATYQLTTGDVAAGRVDNTATATAIDGSTATDSVTIREVVLAYTGQDPNDPLLWATLFSMAGTLLLLAARRRRDSRPAGRL